MFRVTYDIVTPASAEDGDVAEHGFVLPGSCGSCLRERTAGVGGERRTAETIRAALLRRALCTRRAISPRLAIGA